MLKKLIEGPVTTKAPTPVPEFLKIFSWEDDLLPPEHKITLPDNVELIGHLPVDKLVCRTKKVNDPLLGLVTSWEQDIYDATTWTAKAYTKMFEKFHYHDPVDFVEQYAEFVLFCDSITLKEHDYMAGSAITPIMSTEKNVDSTPAYPKFQAYDSEAEYLSEHGWQEYLDVFSSEDTVNHRPLWWCFLKNEVLKKKKIQDNDIRMILCTDPVFTRIGASFEQDQNNRMKQQTLKRAAQVGWTPFFGGLDARIRRLIGKGNRFFVEMDWTRYDGTIPKALFWRIKQMRFFFLRDDFKTPQMKRLYDWYVKNLVEKIILLPTGEVCTVKKGNPSGQFSTTVDNNMCNVWLTAFEISYLFYKQKGFLPTVEEFFQHVDMICYGDDRLVAVDKGFVSYDPDVVIDMYKNIFGMWVKRENVKVQDDPAGLSFCGMTICRQSNGKFVGIPNVDKILSTLQNPTKRLPDIQSLWGKLVSLRILCENAPDNVKDYLELQISNVEEYAAGEEIQLPEVGPDFYSKIW